jgi:SPP1 gp7 family putative phage head morphogenesis protein
MDNQYWQERLAEAQAALTEKNISQTEKQIKKYYRAAAKKVIEDFIAVYEKIVARQEAGEAVTPADLYKLDKYWQAQAQMRLELQKMGEREVTALTKAMEAEYFDIYYSIALPGQTAFNTISKESVTQMVNSIWVADGKSWNQRIWGNTNELVDTLNEGLLHCLVTGKKTTELKRELQDRFNVSYHRADTLVRTEMAHIQTQAAQKRYEDYGINKVQVWADKDERQCEHCGELHQKVLFANETMPVPAHPNCRCVIIPYIED